MPRSFVVVCLEIGCRIHLRRCVVTLKRTLERRSVIGRGAGVWLFTNAVGILHEIVALISLLLATPDPPGNECQRSEDNSTANANYHTDDSVPRLRGHA